MKQGLAIAIDGPAGAGKSTISGLLAAATGFELLDTGAMYRAITWAWLTDCQESSEILPQTSAETHNFVFDVVSNKMRVLCDGKDISDLIRSSEVTSNVSLVAAIAEVRDHAVALQRQYVAKTINRGVGIIVEGRDIGSTVLPNADLKFFLTADPIARATRRALELGRDPEDVIQEIIARDDLDTQREASPLRIPEDAVIVDASHLSIDEVLERMLHQISRVS
jgi:cytidylate kinase